MPINKNELTKEMIAKAMQCKTAEDLMALAKAEGAEITKAEAEAYLAELADIELDEKALKSVAGGSNACWHCLDNCGDGCPCRDQIGASISAVENAYGRPTKSEREMKSYGEKVEYEYGNSLDFEFVNGKLTKIKADDYSDAKTKAGIGLGASMDMVKSAYGEPDYIHEEDFIYYADGLQGAGLKIEIKYGRVTEIKCGVLH